jgi:hypothetical protein
MGALGARVQGRPGGLPAKEFGAVGARFGEVVSPVSALALPVGHEGRAVVLVAVGIQSGLDALKVRGLRMRGDPRRPVRGDCDA